MPKMSWKSVTPPEPVQYLYMGIDPGASGGIAVLTDRLMVVLLAKTPETESDVWMLLKGWKPSTTQRVTAAIEWISPAMFGVAKSSMSKLYGSYMSWRMALIAASIPFVEVKPKEWQKAVGIEPRKKSETTNAWKNRIRGKALQNYPSEKITLDTSDALLVATWLARQSKPGLVA